LNLKFENINDSSFLQKYNDKTECIHISNDINHYDESFDDDLEIVDEEEINSLLLSIDEIEDTDEDIYQRNTNIHLKDLRSEVVIQ